MSELSVGTLSGLAANSYVIDVASGSSLDLSNATDLPASALPAGSIIAVESVLKTDTFSSSVTGGSNVEVTDLSITHAMSDASNKLLITAYFGVAANSDGKGQVGIAVHNGSTLIGVGDSSGSRTPVSAGGESTSGGDTGQVVFPNVTIPYEPGDTASRTYTVRAINIRNTTYTLYVNRNQSDNDTGSAPRGVSALIIQEVAG